MTKDSNHDTTSQNLDKLAEFLSNEIKQATLADKIPTGAHLFHGSYNNMRLTQANIETATSILMEMALGVTKEAPLIMIFEHRPGQQTIIDLGTKQRKQNALQLLKSFQEQNKMDVETEINALLAA